MIITGVCTDFTHDGKGIIKYNGILVFVEGLLIGEEAEVEIVYAAKDYRVGEIKRVLKPSLNRIKPICSIAHSCGGCQLQHFSYPLQLEFKRRVVESAIKKIAKIDVKINDVIGMQKPYFYRNKIQVPVGYNKRKEIVVGFYAENSHNIIPIEKCYIQDEKSEKILKSIISSMKKFKIEPYDEDLGTGIIRHILIKTGYKTKDIMVVLVTTVDSFPARGQLVKEIKKLNEEVSTIVQNINKRDTNVILGEQERILLGKGYLVDELLDMKFKVSSKSFYQVNPVQTEKLYSIALKYADLKSSDKVLDCYSGVGTIGLLASKYCQEVKCVEIVKEAVRNGIQNAKLNNIENVTFIEEDATKYMQENEVDSNVVFIDPPRKGCSQEFLTSLINLQPEKIIYISCNPATLCRDLSFLKDYYIIRELQPVDMFPWTYHVETVVLLFRR